VLRQKAEIIAETIPVPINDGTLRESQSRWFVTRNLRSSSLGALDTFSPWIATLVQEGREIVLPFADSSRVLERQIPLEALSWEANRKFGGNPSRSDPVQFDYETISRSATSFSTLASQRERVGLCFGGQRSPTSRL
jgi:hypothetical protein